MDFQEQAEEMGGYLERLQERLKTAETKEDTRVITKEIAEVETELRDLQGLLEQKDTLTPEEKETIWHKTRRLRSALPLIITGILSFAPFLNPGAHTPAETYSQDLSKQVEKWMKATARVFQDIEAHEKLSQRNKKDSENPLNTDVVFIESIADDGSSFIEA